MRTVIVALLLNLLAGHASADSCPEKYRFVDFGINDRSGVLRRGGTIFRAFDPANIHLLVPSTVICHTVEENAVDGRGLKIPVVSRFDVDLAAAGLSFERLQIRAADNIADTAETNALRHRQTLATTGTVVAQSDTFLCAQPANAKTVSCQFVAPYDPATALVIYCAAQQCVMPVLGFNPQIMISAQWLRTPDTALGDPMEVGLEISKKLQDIQTFLNAQT